MTSEKAVHGERQVEYTAERREHWDEVAGSEAGRSAARTAYHDELRHLFRQLVSPGLRVLELGCGKGDLLAALEPSHGVGVDLSRNMLRLARERHPGLTFIEGDAHTVVLDGVFDVIVLSDLLNDLWDAQRVLQQIKPWCHPGTRIVINVWSRLWQLPLTLARKYGLASPLLEQNWFSLDDVANLLALEDFEVIKQFRAVLLPLDVPVLSTICNTYLAKLPLLNQLCLTNVLIARLSQEPAWEKQPPVVSVVVPARNESGNVTDIIERTPELGGGTELIFVEGNSTDDTWEVIQREVAKYPEKRIKIMQQPGKGKGDAVRTGFAAAEGEILMILDADLTVPPEDLHLFYEAVASGKCEFANGVRLVYPMDKEAMRFCNLVANKGFSIVFSWLLGQSIKDTLCGTKVLSRRNYERVLANRAFFGDFDPFGDYDLIFGAAKQNLKMRDIPIRYRERTYGETNINRWRHGLLLLRMVLFAARRIKFV